MNTFKKLIVILDFGYHINDLLFLSLFEDSHLSDVVIISNNQKPIHHDRIINMQVSNKIDTIIQYTCSAYDSIADKLKLAEYAIKRKPDFDAGDYANVIVCGCNANAFHPDKRVCVEHVIYSGKLSEESSLYLDISDIMAFFYVCKLSAYAKTITENLDIEQIFERLLFRADIPLFKEYQ